MEYSKPTTPWNWMDIRRYLYFGVHAILFDGYGIIRQPQPAFERFVHDSGVTIDEDGRPKPKEKLCFGLWCFKPKESDKGMVFVEARKAVLREMEGI
ncbi:hypothetical protein K469DRAFT_712969 [Zopfia rhizophila CBS 207.26]|uniref:Uncharacterized protein n=1 Tax=Zopfia rhizophila CBS 207.26 TaxID=1314779 RepID=A0A6A6DW61_9PEZI|nr:hypothetical protein K469DRAFT_712969 [Zopfia rhizophila CBS 207.26]